LTPIGIAASRSNEDDAKQTFIIGRLRGVKYGEKQGCRWEEQRSLRNMIEIAFMPSID
jgi:hypothetical protein